MVARGGLELSASVAAGGGLECLASISLVGSEVAAMVSVGWAMRRALGAMVSLEVGWAIFCRARG